MSEIQKAKDRRAALRLIKEQQKKLKMDKLFIKHGIRTDSQIEKEIKDRYDQAFKSHTLESRQKFLDLMHTGKTFGEAREEAGISFDCASEVMKRAIKETHFLSKEVKE